MPLAGTRSARQVISNQAGPRIGEARRLSRFSTRCSAAPVFRLCPERSGPRPLPVEGVAGQGGFGGLLSALRFMYCCCIVIIRGQTNHHKSRYFVSLAADVSRPSPWRKCSYFLHRKKTGPISLARQSGFAPRLDSNSARPIVVMCEVLDLGPRARRSRDCWRLSLLRKGRLLRSPSPLHALYGSRGMAHATHALRARRGGLPASLVLGAACCC